MVGTASLAPIWSAPLRVYPGTAAPADQSNQLGGSAELIRMSPFLLAQSSFAEMKSTFIQLQNEFLPKAIDQALLVANNNV